MSVDKLDKPNQKLKLSTAGLQQHLINQVHIAEGTAERLKARASAQASLYSQGIKPNVAHQTS